MSVAQNLEKLHDELDALDCTLVAVSKTKPIDLIMEAYETGHRDFGENKVQDLVAKYENMPKDIQWHMIGHLQRNKVKYIAPFVHLIHGVDSERLLKEVNKQGLKAQRTLNCLLQVHIAEEETKFGFDHQEIKTLFDSGTLEGLSAVKIVGLMGMSTFTDQIDQVRREFQSLKNLFDELSCDYSIPNVEMKTLSMGMSGDYKIAVEAGSNMVRIGTTIFGARN